MTAFEKYQKAVFNMQRKTPTYEIILDSPLMKYYLIARNIFLEFLPNTPVSIFAF